jgi:hypothetical protein
LYGSVLEASHRLPTVYLLQTPVAYVNEHKTLVANGIYPVVVTNRTVTNKKSLEDRGWGLEGEREWERPSDRGRRACGHTNRFISVGSF